MKNIIYGIVIILLLAACSENSTSPIIEASNKNELIPLKVGNTWTYNYEMFDGTQPQNSTVTIDVISEFVYKNEKHFRLQFTNNTTKQIMSDPFYYINKPDGFYIINDSGRTEPEIIKLNYPTYGGDVIDESEYYKIYVDSIDCIYTTPMGKFKCIKFVNLSRFGEQIDSRTDNYYAPGIGMIATEHYRNMQNSENLVLTHKRVIISYNFK